MTLACEDAYSRLDVVTVADVIDEDRFESWSLYSEARFGQEFNFRFSQDADVWLRF